MSHRLLTVLAPVAFVILALATTAAAEPRAYTETTRLPAPAKVNERAYLGLGETAQTFDLREVEGSCLLVQVYSAYCPHCQAEVPTVNEMVGLLELAGDAAPRFLAVGANNTPYEVDLFRDRYKTEYIMVADEDMSASFGLGAQVTPTYILLDITKDNPTVLYTQEGGIEDASAFASTIIKQCAERP